jgi:hypothetical protein
LNKKEKEILEYSTRKTDYTNFLTPLYHRIEDDFLVVIRSIPLFKYIEKSRIDEEIEKLINFRHPCIAGPIGFVFQIYCDSLHQLKMI